MISADYANRATVRQDYWRAATRSIAMRRASSLRVTALKKNQMAQEIEAEEKPAEQA